MIGRGRGVLGKRYSITFSLTAYMGFLLPSGHKVLISLRGLMIALPVHVTIEWFYPWLTVPGWDSISPKLSYTGRAQCHAGEGKIYCGVDWGGILHSLQTHSFSLQQPKGDVIVNENTFTDVNGEPQATLSFIIGPHSHIRGQDWTLFLGTPPGGFNFLNGLIYFLWMKLLSTLRVIQLYKQYINNK